MVYECYCSDHHGKLLKKGSRGKAVKAIQELLNVHPISGYFGPKTEERVRNFQSLYELHPDGIVGPKTSEAIRQYIYDRLGYNLITHPRLLI